MVNASIGRVRGDQYDWLIDNFDDSRSDYLYWIIFGSDPGCGRSKTLSGRATGAQSWYTLNNHRFAKFFELVYCNKLIGISVLPVFAVCILDC